MIVAIVLRPPCHFLAHLRLWHKGTDLPVVSTLVAWPQFIILVHRLVWLCSDVTAQHPPPLELILAWATAAGNTPQCCPAHAEVQVCADVVVCTDAIELSLRQDHLVVWKGQDIRHGVGHVVVAHNQCPSFMLYLHALAHNIIQARGIAQQTNTLVSWAHSNGDAVTLNPLG